MSRQAGVSPDLDEAANFGGGHDGTLNDRDGDFNPNPDREFDDEDEAEEAKANGPKDANTLYRDPATGQPFDASKKFGIIEDE